MDHKLVLAITVALLMTGSAMALAGAYASAPVSPISTSMGNYSFSYYSGNGTIVNLSYTGEDSQGNNVILNQVQVSGKNLTLPVMNSDVQGSQDTSMMNIHNETLVSGQDSNALMIITKAGIASSASETFHFNTTLVQVSTSVNLESSDSFFGSMDTMFSISSQAQYRIYEISHPNFTGYFVSNAATQTISDSNHTIQVSGSSGSIVVSGIVASGNIKDFMQKYYKEHEYGNKFVYNTATGKVSGRFVDFTFNTTTASINNYSVNGTHKMVIFNSISGTGNGSIGTQSEFPAFRTGVPMVYGSLFFYANSSFIYTVHDNPSLQFNIILNNGTMKFNISNNLNVTNLSAVSGLSNERASVNETEINQNFNASFNATVGADHEFERGKYMYIINNDTFRGMFYVSGGSASYNSTTGILSVITNGTASIHFVAPPGLNQIPEKDFKPIQYGIEHGRIAAQISIDSLNNTAVNFTMLYNNSVAMKITTITTGKVQIAVSASEHTGTNLVFFVNQSFLNSNGKIYVYFDGVLANLTTVNGTINITSSVNAYYGFEQVNGGYLVVVHVPHFSNHSITITDSLIQNGTTPTSLNLNPLEIGIIAVVVVAAIAGAVVAIRRR